MYENENDIIDKKIDDITSKNNAYHIGKVIKIHNYVVEAKGLDDAFFNEKVTVGDPGNIGYVEKIDKEKVYIALVKIATTIRIGMDVILSGELLTSNFSENSMGMVIDAFGVDRLSGKNFNDSRPILFETPEIPLMDRTPVNRMLHTGIAAIDLMYPIGRGQRQLILGDKKTGKSQICLDTIVNQTGQDVICIYVTIGKTKKEVKKIYSKLIEKRANAYTIIVAALNDDPMPLVKLTPYAGLSIAEEYMKMGKDVLVCIDDLKKHASACREIALISEKNTGRDAYPSDIFYMHARMLEKGCQHKCGGSITILPITETKGGDITDYISTNIISITDGQIVLSDKAFQKGQKPAVDFGLSVSRLGGAVQSDELKKVGTLLHRTLLEYLETADVYQLVNIDSLSTEFKAKLRQGQELVSLLIQEKYKNYTEDRLIEMFTEALDIEKFIQEVKSEKSEDTTQMNSLDNQDNNSDNNNDDSQEENILDNEPEEIDVENLKEQKIDEILDEVSEEVEENNEENQVTEDTTQKLEENDQKEQEKTLETEEKSKKKKSSKKQEEVEETVEVSNDSIEPEITSVETPEPEEIHEEPELEKETKKSRKKGKTKEEEIANTEEVKNKTNINKRVSLRGTISYPTYIDVTYIVTDPEEKYQAVYLLVTGIIDGEMTTKKYIVDKYDTKFRIRGLNTKSEYSISLGYIEVVDAKTGTLVDYIEDIINVRTQPCDATLKVDKVSGGYVHFTFKMTDKYAFESAKISVYAENQKGSSISIDYKEALSKDGFKGSLRLSDARIYELRVEEAVYNGMDVNTGIKKYFTYPTAED